MKLNLKTLGIFGLIVIVALGLALALIQFAPSQESTVTLSPAATAEPTVTLTPAPTRTPVPTATSVQILTPTPVTTPPSETDIDALAERIKIRWLDDQTHAVYRICTPSACGTASYIKSEELDGSMSYYILTAAHILCNDDGDTCSRTAAVRRISIGEPTDWYETRVVHIDWAKDVALLNPVTELRQVFANYGWVSDFEWFDTALPVGHLPPRGSEMVAIASNGLSIEMINDRESYSGSCSRPDHCTPVMGQALGGTSGSPIIDAYGRVVGIITSGWKSDRQHIAITTGDGILRAITDAPKSETTTPLPTPTPSAPPTSTPVPTATPINPPTPDPNWDSDEFLARLNALQLNHQMHAVYQICTLEACGTASYVRFTELDGSVAHYIITAAHVLCINGDNSCSHNAAVRRVFVGVTDWHETRLLHIDWAKDIALLSPVNELTLRYDTLENEWFDAALGLAFLPPRRAEIVARASNAFTIEMANDEDGYSGSCSGLDYCVPVLGEVVDGMSGSPVFDRWGRFIGIVIGPWKSDLKHVAIATGDGIFRAIRDFQDSQ